MAGILRPIQSLRVAVTRAEEKNAELAAALRAAGATVYDIPLTRVEILSAAELDEAVSALRSYDWVLLTSANAVRRFEQSIKTSVQRDLLRMRKLAVVGAATAGACEERGWIPTVVPSRYSADSLVDAMASRSDVEGARMLYPAAAAARDVLPDGLRALGATVVVIPVYRTAPDPEGQALLRALVREGELDLVTVMAPSAVDSLLDAVPAEYARRIPVACIGPVTSRAARAAGFPVRVESTMATSLGLARSIIAAYGKT